jgi:F-type H+-transporting ATPase subunit b
MLIDWFTVGAQTLNFLVLVWLLKRFLYKPILDAVDAREKRIATELAQADAQQTKADQERETFRLKNAAFDQQRDDLLTQAKAEAKAERQRQLDETRHAAEALRVKREEALNAELESLQQDITQRSRDEVFATARKVLSDLADTTLEARMVDVLARRLRELDADTKAELTQALALPHAEIMVRTAHALSPSQQTTLSDALVATFTSPIQLRFDTSAQVIGGIELSANGWRLPWNIADLLTALEKNIGQQLRAPSARPAHAPPPSKAP